MDKSQKYREWTFRFLQGSLPEEQEFELCEAIKNGDYPKELFLKNQDELSENLISSINLQQDTTWESLKNRIEAKQKPVRPIQRRLNQGRFIAIAAAFVMGVLISGAFYFLRSDFYSNQMQAQVQEITIPYGAKTKINLPDGSTAWLNSGSKLVYPVIFTGKRDVILEGEAFFEVVKGKNPFIVSTEFGQVQVLGTSFNVKAFSNEEFQATLLEGSVQLTGFGENPVFLKPGEQASFDANAGLAVKQVNTELYTSWKDGKLIFYREPFAKVALSLERWYNVKLEINNDELKELWFTGTVEMETFTEFMELISKSFPIRYTYEQQTRTLTIGKK
ncbi:FecR family protein [Gaoshiqia sp. Z1-71]|uniref:FecR family protein n=1 Tax=Gaoshiqia hydrogeniformans TaxID=3290090 RepID=UPI003BF88D78